MTRDRDTRWVPDDRLKALGLAIAAFGPMAVAGIFVPFRTDTLIASNMGLVFVIVVVLAAAQGGRTCGIISAVMSTFTYDFFFTRPYQSLKIDRLEDVGTAVLLLVIGLLVAELMGFAHASRTRAERIHTEMDRVHRIGELAASGVPGAVVAHAVEVELIEMLALAGCHYES